MTYVLVVGLACHWLWMRPGHSVEPEDSRKQSEKREVSQKGSLLPQPDPAHPRQMTTNRYYKEDSKYAGETNVYKILLDGTQEMNRPISFYGQIVDEANGKFGKIEAQIDSTARDDEGRIVITYWLNPSGSRNLRYDEKKRIRLD